MNIQITNIEEEMLEEKLEELKQAGNYQISVYYGEEIGCDDLDIRADERKVLICAYPVGVLGSVKILFVGNLKTLKDFSMKSKPKKLNNPPKSKDYEKNGFYVWGTEDGLKTYFSRNFKRKFPELIGEK